MLKVIFIYFCPDFLVLRKNDLIRKLRLISKFMKSQAGQLILTIHILPNISRYKGNHTMELGQLIEYSMRNIFSQKSYR